MEKRRFISKKKIVCNIKKYYWICLVIVALALVIAFLMGIKSKKATDNTSNQSQIETTAIQNNAATKATTATTSSVKYYQADVVVFVKESVTLSNYQYLYMSSSITKRINEILKENNYDLLNSNDTFSSTVRSGNLITFTAVGTKNPDRVELIANTLAELAMDLGDENNGVKTTKKFDYGEAFEVSKNSSGAYVKLYTDPDNETKSTIQETTSAVKDSTTAAAKESTVAQSSETEEQSASSVNKVKLVKTAVVMMLIGFIIGCFIIYVIILLDNTVYVQEDVCVCEEKTPFLGYISPSELAFTVTALATRIKNEKKSSVALMEISSKDSKETEDINKITKMLPDVDVKQLNSIDAGSDFVEALNNVDGVILVVRSGKDKERTINSAVERINIIQANLMGYIMD